MKRCHAHTTTANAVPPVLPRLVITVGPDGALDVALDGPPYEQPDRQPLDRTGLGTLLDQVAASSDTPVRVEIVESDGSTFSDILLPRQETEEAPATISTPSMALTEATPGWMNISSEGFMPGESVAVSIVVAHLTADLDGVASLRLPERVLAGRAGGIALIGDESGTFARTLPNDQDGRP